MIFSFENSRTGGLSRAVAQQWPLFGKGAPVHFWAERGLVQWEDQRETVPQHKKRGRMDWRDAAERVLALSEMVMKSSEDSRWANERQRLQKFISEMEEVIRKAKEQGGPNDGGAVRRAHLRSRTTTFLAPSVVDLEV